MQTDYCKPPGSPKKKRAAFSVELFNAASCTVCQFRGGYPGPHLYVLKEFACALRRDQ